MNATTSSIPQYTNESLEFITNSGNDLVNQVTYPLLHNITMSKKPKEITQPINEKCSTYFPCENVGCNKTYASISGLNNHIKK